MLKTIAAVMLLVLSLGLHGCSTTGISGLVSYVDTTDGYEFLYPNGWLPVKVSDGPDIVLHDMIERSENVSVVISDVPDGKTLTDLGTPGEVGYQLQKKAIAPPDSGRVAELINAEVRKSRGQTYYLLEYNVKLPNEERHNVASVAVSRGKLFTFNTSTTEKRWTKLKEMFEIVAKSFTVS